jgi:pimeloyl-ACP methyl ester carboxylesterase
VIVLPGIAGSWYSSKSGWLMDPILHTYDDLLESLRMNGYEDGKTLFPLPYNWRQDNTFSAYELGQKIDYAISTSGVDKVDIVAHSMGGLVARKYLEDTANLEKVDDLIFLGTPQQGAPKAYPIWEAGEGFDSLSDKALRSLIKFEADSGNAPSLLYYIRNNILSLQQLLPSYEYILGRDYDPLNFPDNYPYNNWLIDLNSDSTLLDLNNSNINIYNLRGQTSGTVTLYETGEIDLNSEYWPHGEVTHIYKGAGDGTVPELSSNLFTSIEISGASHQQLPTEARAQVIEILTGVATTVPTAQIPTVEHLMTIGVYSPLDFRITTPSGQRIGLDLPSTDEINEIPLAFYSGVQNENEYATMINPEAGDYIMEVLGTGNGDFKIGVDVVSEIYGESIDNYLRDNIQFNQTKTYIISLSYDQYSNPQVKIEKQVDDTNYFNRINELCLNGEINKKVVCQYLKVKYRFLEKKFSLYNKTRNTRLKRAIKWNIELTIKHLEFKLKFFKQKNWVSESVYELLRNDLLEIKESL